MPDLQNELVLDKDGACESIPESAAPARRSAAKRAQAGLFARRTAKRLSVEQILRCAKHLPDIPRGLVTGYFELAIPVKELAVIYRLSPTQVRRRISHWRDTLCDPSFLLAAEFAKGLPNELAALARAHWIEGQTLRELAGSRGTTLHRIRSRLNLARSLMVLVMSNRQVVDPIKACEYLE